jgi:hypothetical protein
MIGWRFYIKGGVIYVIRGGGWPSSAHALRDAWTWCGPNTPALIYT